MATPLRSRLSDLASSFAASVLDAIRRASLEDLLAQSSGRGASPASRPEGDAASPGPRRKGKRLPRRSAKDIAHVIDGVVALLKESPHGLRAEQIRDKLGLQAKELPRPLKEGLDSGRLSKSGQKRATTYFAKGAAGASAAGGRSSAGGRRGGRGAKSGRARRRAKSGASPKPAKKVSRARKALKTPKAPKTAQTPKSQTPKRESAAAAPAPAAG